MHGKTGQLRKVTYGTKVADLVGESDVKAVAIGTKLFDRSVLDLAIEEDTQIGNGVITLYDSGCCMIHEAEQVLLEERRKCCGRCTFCREGLVQLHTMTKEITEGKGKREYPELMAEIGEAMTFSTACSLGQTASDFTLGTLNNFAAEYDEHIKKKKCANNVCAAFMSIYIDPNVCTGCGECVDVCPADAIEGRDGFIHMIDEFACTKCGKCASVCEADAVIQTTGRVPKLPNRLTKCGKFRKH
jgi:ferredoxin